MYLVMVCATPRQHPQLSASLQAHEKVDNESETNKETKKNKNDARVKMLLIEGSPL